MWFDSATDLAAVAGLSPCCCHIALALQLYADLKKESIEDGRVQVLTSEFESSKNELESES